MEESKDNTWWQCSYFKEDSNSFVIGEYLVDEEGLIKLWMGEEAECKMQGDAYLEGLENAVQFLLEDLNGSYENVVLVSNRKDIVTWINGGLDTCWDDRFLRNKAVNKRHVFHDFQLIYRNDRDFKAKEQWENLARIHEGRWIQG
ncbi:hypothetical protein PIB30_020736, partial [Stylosanthes scabra]|nr:hypothetical protein [Stylosanthes scabra]